MRKLLRGLAVIVITVGVASSFAAAAEPVPEEFYARYAAALEKHVDARGMVNYRALKAAPADLDAFLHSVAHLESRMFKKWSEPDRIAFWINVYNALTLKAIINNYPIEADGVSAWRYPKNSIRQIDGVWKDLNFRVLRHAMTLDEIEHKTLRKDFSEARIHVALVCAAKGCPRLLNKPYEGATLKAQFEAQARSLLSQSKKFRIDRRKKVVYLSAIFDWFDKDFKSEFALRRGFGRHSGATRAVLHFVSLHVDAADARYLRKGDYKVKHLDYDWTLNEQ
jgi:uncharacterized protein DUF547